MALRLRRGIEAERLTITPQAGELIYTTDTKKVFVGDGITPGGNPIDSTIGSLSVNDLTDVNTIGDSTAPADGEVLAWDANNQEWRPKTLVTNIFTETDPTVNGNLKVNIVGDDSTLLVDAANNSLYGATIDAIDITASDIDSNNLTSINVYANNIYTTDSSALSIQNATVFASDALVQGNMSVNNNLIIKNMVLDRFGLDHPREFAITSDTGNFTVGSLEKTGRMRLIINDSSSTFADGFVMEQFHDATDAVDFAFYRTRGTNANPQSLQTNDEVAEIMFYGHNGTQRVFGISQAAIVEDTPTANGMKTGLRWRASNGTSSSTIATLNYDSRFNIDKLGSQTTGEVAMQHALTLKTYANAGARDADIIAPTAGMIVFVTDADGFGTPKFQGNTDGTLGGWVDLN